MSDQQLQQIFDLYTEFMQHAVHNTPEISLPYYNKLNLLHQTINSFLNTAFATPSIQATLHNLRSRIPNPTLADMVPQHFVLPPSIPLPHHVTYVDDPNIDISTIKQGSLVRYHDQLFIVKEINFNAPLTVQDIDFYLKKMSSTQMHYFNHKNLILTNHELNQLKPITIDQKPNYGDQIIKYQQAQNENYTKAQELALKSPYQKNYAKLLMGLSFTIQRIVFEQQNSQKCDVYYSPLFSGISFSDEKIVNYLQIQPLIDPFEDLMVPQITTLCSFFDKQTNSFKPGKILQQASRVNRFHFQLQEIVIDYDKLASKSISKSVFSVLNECCTVKNEMIITVFCKFVTNIVCQIQGEEICTFLNENGKEGMIKDWIDSFKVNK